MKQKHKWLLVCALVSVIIVAVLFISGVFNALANGSIIITLVDKETGKRIGRVGYSYTKVFVDDLDYGFLTDEGELKISGLSPGEHKLTLNIPYYGNYTKYVSVGMLQTVNATIVVDMPNPVFEVAIRVDQAWHREKGKVYVTITNVGNMPSVNTKVLIFILREDSPTTPVDSTIQDVGELSPISGSSTTTLQSHFYSDKTAIYEVASNIHPYLWQIRPINPPEIIPKIIPPSTKTIVWETWAFEPGKWEIVAVAILDGWPFTPQNRQVVGQTSIPVDDQEAIISSLLGWIERNLGKILDTIVGFVLAKYLS
jgi:hypothetical protein